MNRQETLDWLADLQHRFGELIRKPLDRHTGTLRAQTESYSPTLCQEILPGPHATSADRLAVYHRQYWFRLFTVLQNEYRLTAHLLGMWHFNDLAAHYLAAHAPHSFDLQHVAIDFVPFLSTFLPEATGFEGVPRAALLEAAVLDHTFARVFLAPEVERLDTQQLAGQLTEAQLRLAPTVALIAEHWPLMELRRACLEATQAGRAALPPALGQAQFWAVFRTDMSQRVAPLEPIAYRLFTLLSQHNLSEALARLEASCDASERDSLPGKVHGLLRDSVQAGFWAA